MYNKQAMPQISKILFLATFLFVANHSIAQNWNTTAKLDTIFNKSGQIESIKNQDNYEDILFMYDTSGKVSRIILTTKRNGKQYEEITEYYPNGIVSASYFYCIMDKMFYGKSQLDSTCTEYYENGNMKIKCVFIKNKLNGQAIHYYPNGNIEFETYFKDDKLMNIKYYNSNGNQLNTGDFKDGNGRLINYEDGIQVSICRYKNGKLIKRSCGCN